MIQYNKGEEVELRSADFNIKDLEGGDFSPRNPDRPSLPEKGVATFAILKLPRYVYNRDGNKEIIQGTRSTNFPTRFSGKIERTMEVNNEIKFVKAPFGLYQYYEEIVPKMQRGNLYNTLEPRFLSFKEKGLMNINTELQPDLWWFMMHSPLCQDGFHHDAGKMPIFRLLDFDLMARREIQKEENEYIMGALLFGTKSGLPEEPLREAAKVFGLLYFDDMKPATIRIALKKYLIKTKQVGKFVTKYQDYLRIERAIDIEKDEVAKIDLGSDSSDELSKLATKLEEFRCIAYNDEAHKWMQSRDYGETFEEPLVDVGQANYDKRRDILISFLRSDRIEREGLKSILDLHIKQKEVQQMEG